MFLQPLKTLLTLALRNTFDETHPAEEWLKYGKGDGSGRLNVSIDFPIEEHFYPGIWVDFEPTRSLRNVGIGHREYDETVFQGEVAFEGIFRWEFAGMATYTIVAMTSAVRDRLVDEVAKIMIVGREDPIRGRFRQTIEDNDLIAINFDWDEVSLSGFTATPGTPWGTDDVIYEATLRMECIGEFLVHPDQPDVLLPLSSIEVTPYSPPEVPDPTDDDGWR